MSNTNANLIWKIADLLRGSTSRTQYGELSQGPVGDDVAGIDRERLVRDIR
jgi:hypothetical protein